MNTNNFLADVICAIACFVLFILPIWYFLSDDMNIGRFIFILFLCFVDLIQVIFCNCGEE